MSEMRRLMDATRLLFEDPETRADEAFDAPFQLLLRTITPDDPKWRKAVTSTVELPDGSNLLLQAAQRRPVRRRAGDGSPSPGMWEVGFVRSKPNPATPLADLEDDDWDDAVTGQGLQQRVFATVLDFVRRLAKEHGPDEIRFGVETASGRGDRRASLYHRMAKRFAGSVGYEVRTEPDPTDPQSTLFRLKRNT